MNTPKSLELGSGLPSINTSFTLDVNNPLGGQGCPTFTGVVVCFSPDPAYPCGTIMPLWGMAPGTDGELLVDLSVSLGITGPLWGCTTGPSVIPLAIPGVVALVGQKLYIQGVMGDLSPVGIALTNALEVTIGNQPTPINFGTTIGAEINPHNEIDVYEFTADAGDQIVMPFVRRTGSGTFELGLYDSVGLLLQKTSPLSSTVFTHTIPVSGRYMFSVRTTNGWTGKYEFSLRRTRNTSGSTSITFGSTTASPTTIARATEIDVFDFAALAGDEIVLPFVRRTGTGTFVLELFDSTGVSLQKTPPLSSTVLTQTIPASGTYYLWIRTSNWWGGDYEFSLRRTVNPFGSTNVTFGSTTNAGATIARATEIDVFDFAALAGDEIVLPFVRRSGSGTFVLELYDAAGVSVQKTPPLSETVFTQTIPVSGTYYLWIRTSNWWGGNYEFSLRRTLNPVGSTNVTFGSTTSPMSTITRATEIDVFDFAALAGDEIVLPFVRRSGSGTFVLQLYDSTGVPLQTTSPLSETVFTHTIPASGTYSLWIRTSNWWGGDYEFSLRRTMSPAGCTLTTPTVTTTGTITRATEIDCFDIKNAPGGFYFNIPFTRTSGSGTFELSLYDAAGVFVGASSAAGSGTLKVKVPSTGDYTLWVRTTNWWGGNYSFTLNYTLN